MPDVARTSAGTLLLHESRARKAIERAIGETSSQAAAEVRRSSRKRAATLAAVVLLGRALGARLGRIVAEHRQGVRSAATRRVHAELMALGVGVGALFGDRNPGSGLRVDEDDARGEVAGVSLATQWQAIALAAALKSAREDHAQTSSLTKLSTLMKPKAARTAATEVASAYNAEHAQVLRDAADKDEKLAKLLRQVGRSWDARLDKRTCSTCDGLDGTVVGYDEDFSRGEPPIHVSCRCIVTLVSLS